MEKYKIVNVFDALSRVIDLSEEKKEEMIGRFEGMSEVDAIKELALVAYRVVGSDDELYDYTLSVIRNINPTICPNVSEMKQIISKMYSNDVDGRESCIG